MELWLRTRHDRNRPLLRTADPLTRLEELHRARDPLYRETAHLIVDTGNQAIRNLVGRLERELRALTPVDTDPHAFPLLTHSGQPL
jgi:shikimate kinase